MDKGIAIRMVGILHIIFGLVAVLFLVLFGHQFGFYSAAPVDRVFGIIAVLYFYAGYNLIILKQTTKTLSLILSFLTILIIILYMPDSLRILHQDQTPTQHTKVLFMIQGALVFVNAYIIYVLVSPQYKSFFKQ